MAAEHKEMKRSPIISPSLLAAEASDYAAAITCVEQAGAQFLHIDVMDGHFVPNLSFGPNIVSGIRACSGMFLDVHLMVEEPLKFAEPFIKAGADGITIHPEAADNPYNVLSLCRLNGVQFGLALKPETALESVKCYLPDCDILLMMSIQPGFGGQPFMPKALEKIQLALKIRETLNAHYKISVDGGINLKTAKQCLLAGADILVAGSAIFGNKYPANVISALKGGHSS